MKTLLRITGYLSGMFGGWFLANHFTNGTPLLWAVPGIVVALVLVLTSETSKAKN